MRLGWCNSVDANRFESVIHIQIRPINRINPQFKYLCQILIEENKTAGMSSLEAFLTTGGKNAGQSRFMSDLDPQAHSFESMTTLAMSNKLQDNVHCRFYGWHHPMSAWHREERLYLGQHLVEGVWSYRERKALVFHPDRFSSAAFCATGYMYRKTKSWFRWKFDEVVLITQQSEKVLKEAHDMFFRHGRALLIIKMYWKQSSASARRMGWVWVQDVLQFQPRVLQKW